MFKQIRLRWKAIGTVRRIWLLVALGSFLCAFVPMLYGAFNIGVWLLYGVALGTGTAGVCWEGIRRRRWLHRSVVGVTACALAFFCTMSALMAYQAFFHRPPVQGEVALIVLGGKVTGDQPSLILRHRLNTAAKYLLANPEAACIVSGGQGADEDYPEAVVMAAYLEGKGVARQRITQEAASTNTRENLAFSAQHIPEGTPVVIVTDSFHQLRASIFARAEGLSPPYALSSFTPPGLLPCYWMRDLFGVVVAWIQTA